MGGSTLEASRSGSALRSVSSDGTEAAAHAVRCEATKEPRGGSRGTGRVPPLDSRRGAVRSGVLVGVLLTPTGCPAASERGFNVRAT